jgi:hypothetical protein
VNVFDKRGYEPPIKILKDVELSSKYPVADANIFSEFEFI